MFGQLHILCSLGMALFVLLVLIQENEIMNKTFTRNIVLLIRALTTKLFAVFMHKKVQGLRFLLGYQ